MPINDPVRNRKIAPASLAFEGLQKGSGAFQVGSTINETTIQEVYNLYFNQFTYLFITNEILETNSQKIMIAMNHAEHRSKHWVGDYKRSLQWDIKQNQVYTVNLWNNIAYNSEILRAIGARTYGTPVNGSARWEFICPEDAEGSWWFHAHMNIKYAQQDNVFEGRLAFFINGIIYRIIDMVDRHMMGENQIRDMRLQGGCHVPLRAGDLFEVRFMPVGNQGITNTTLYPDSIYAFVSGHRENCEGYVPRNAPARGNLYTFDHNA